MTEHIEGPHVVMVGPIQGVLTLNDGTRYDVGAGTGLVVESSEHEAELAHLVCLHYAAEGHPHDVEYDDETGLMVQRPFDYQPPDEFADYVPNADNRRLEA